MSDNIYAELELMLLKTHVWQNNEKCAVYRAIVLEARVVNKKHQLAAAYLK